MKTMPINRAYTLMESGPVVLVTTFDGAKHNIMTISWTMVMDFTPRFAMTTGDWNHSYQAIRTSNECVIAIPTLDLIDQVVGIGTCSGANIDKFATFSLTPIKAKQVGAPLIKQCLANIECKVVELIERHNIVILDGIAAYFDTERQEQRTLHAVGDGTFIVDGQRLDRKEMMRSKLPEGI